MNDFNIKEHQPTYYNIDKSPMKLVIFKYYVLFLSFWKVAVR